MQSKRTSVAIGVFLTLTAVCGPTWAEDLKITVVEGEGSLNNIRTRRAKEPVVRIEDSRGRPVRDAAVNFILPAHGPGGTFTGGELSLTVTTGADGVAVGRGLKPNKTAGPFQIRVSSSASGNTAVASINQVNVEPAGAGSGQGKKIAIIALIGGAAVGGLVAATRGGGSSAASTGGNAAVPSAGGTTITPGAPGFGPPR